MRPRTVSQRLVLVTAISLLPAVFIGASAFLEVRKDRLEALHKEAFRASEMAALELAQIVSSSEHILIAISALPSVQRQETAACSAALDDIVALLPFLAAALIINADGSVRCRSGSADLDEPAENTGYYKAALAQEGRVVGAMGDGMSVSLRLLPVARRIGGTADAPLAVAVALLDLNWLQRQMAMHRLDNRDSLAVVDHTGTILVRFPDPEKWVGTQMRLAYQWLMAEKVPGTLEVNGMEGERRVLGYFPADTNPSGLYVSAGRSVAVGMAVAKTVATTATLIGLAGALLACLLALYTASKYITQPIGTVVDTVLAWRRGERSARTRMRAQNGEIGAAGEALDAFMDELELSQAARQTSEAERDLLRNELDHRLGNLISTIQAVARQTFDQTRNAPEMDAFSQRLAAMRDANEILRQADWSSMSLHALARASVRPFIGPKGRRCRISGPGLVIQGRVALALGMALHELGTNAVKYGALSNETGMVAIRWRIDPDAAGDRFVLVWSETGGPPVTPATRSGFGTKVIKTALAAQIGGTVEIAYDPGGVVCTVTAPSENVLVALDADSMELARAL